MKHRHPRWLVAGCGLIVLAIAGVVTVVRPGTQAAAGLEGIDVPGERPEQSPAPGARFQEQPGGLVQDRTSGKLWQRDVLQAPELDLDQASNHCAQLKIGGFEGWHLATISELRSLIKGCEETRPGGSCGITDDLPDLGGRTSASPPWARRAVSACAAGTDGRSEPGPSCQGCQAGGGPGGDGCYLDASFARAAGGTCGVVASATRPSGTGGGRGTEREPPGTVCTVDYGTGQVQCGLSPALPAYRCVTSARPADPE